MSKAQTVTVEEAAELLGVTRGSAYKAIRMGEFPVPIIKVGKKILVPKKKLLTLLAEGATDQGVKVG